MVLDLGELIGCLSLASLVISGNSGTMHLAAALGQPQVALHGPAGAVKWGPLNRNARVVESTCPECPCLDMGWEYHRTDGFCMSRIPVDAVLEPALRILAHSRSPAGIGEVSGSTRASSPGSRGKRVLEMQGSGG